jgi:hypothetical protein
VLQAQVYDEDLDTLLTPEEERILQEFGILNPFGDDDDEFIIDSAVTAVAVTEGAERAAEEAELLPDRPGSNGVASRAASGQGGGLIDWTAGKGIVDRVKSVFD